MLLQCHHLLPPPHSSLGTGLLGLGLTLPSLHTQMLFALQLRDYYSGSASVASLQGRGVNTVSLLLILLVIIPLKIFFPRYSTSVYFFFTAAVPWKFTCLFLGKRRDPVFASHAVLLTELTADRLWFNKPLTRFKPSFEAAKLSFWREKHISDMEQGLTPQVLNVLVFGCLAWI